jgi:hypothetical protein
MKRNPHPYLVRAQLEELRTALRQIIAHVETPMSGGGWITRLDSEVAKAKELLQQQEQEDDR